MSRVVLILLSVLVFSACGNQQEVREYAFDDAYAPYISAFTSERISRQSTIRLRMTSDVIERSMVGYTTTNPFEFTPAIEGTARWMDRRTIEFEPEEVLPSDTYYKVRFPLSKYIENLPEDLSEFDFAFETHAQNFEVNIAGTQPVDPAKMEWQAVNGTVIMADFEYPEKVEELLTARQNGKAMKIKWNHGLDGREHGFRIDSVERVLDPGMVELSWNGAVIGVDKSDELAVPIPALGDFKLLGAETFTEPEQYILLKFSDPLKKKQKLNGLVRMEGISFRYVIKGNEVRCYPRSAVSGEHELHVEPGVRNLLGHKMQEPKSFDITFEQIMPQVRLVGNGNILPRSGNSLPFAFEAVSLKAVEVRIKKIFENNILQFLQVNDLEGDYQLHRVGRVVHTSTVKLDGDKNVNLHKWNRHVLDLNSLIKADPGAIYRVEIDFKHKHSVYTCDDGDEGEAPEEELAEEGDSEVEATEEVTDFEEEDSYWDNYEVNSYSRNWENRENPCHPAYYNYYSRAVSKNVLASDLGVIAKRGTDGSMFFAVNDMRSTAPIGGAQVELYDFQQQKIGSGTTDPSGMATFEVKDDPFVLVVKNGKQRGYLKMADGYSLSLSKFDISGQRYYQGVKGYIYGERGVWRPGDSIYVTFMLEDKLKSLPEDHPVTFSLYNPRGQLIKKAVKRKHVKGVYTFLTATRQSAPTGNYRLNVKVGGASFDKNLKVETVAPNRLKIKIDFHKEFLAKDMEDLEGDLAVRWLHGAIAKNLSADVGVTLTSQPTRFKRYTDYVFDDPVRRFDSDQQTIFEGQLDEEGQAKVPLRVSVEDAAPGMLKANFVTKVFEPGGNFSTDRFSIPYYPYERFVGIKLPKGDRARGMLLTDKDQPVSIVMLNADGKPTGTDSVEVSLYKLSWKWWWDQSAQNITNYNERFYQQKVSTDKVKVTNGEGKWKFQVKYPAWGRYMVRVCDGDGHCTGKVFYIDWPGWAGRGRKDNPGGASMLTFSADKSKYNVGETVTLTIPAGKNGRALVSLENGARVLQSHWVQADANGSAKFSFQATKTMAPNVYAHISLIQPHAQTENDLPMRMYGVVPIEVVDPQTVLKPQIKMAEVLRPMERVSVNVSESSGKPMTYTVAVVDEGLLDLTRFATPEPWKTFYAKEALDVKTWDLYDKVAGAYGADLTKLLGIGGDGSLGPKGGTKVNRFRPVVKFLGPFRLEAGKSAKHTFMMPNYIGSVRTMVVAREGAAYGSTEKATPVRKPLMVLGTLPRVLGPEEEVRLPVTIFAMEKHVKDVKIKLEASDIFEIKGARQHSMHFAKPGDDLAYFDLKVQGRVGKGEIKVTATSGSEKAVYHIDIDVRNPNPRVVNVEEQALEAGKNWIKDFRYPGMKGTNAGVLEVSNIPPLNLGRRLQYLIRYPHGCIEQTTSSVFPQLYVSNLMDLNKSLKNEISNNIRAGIDRLIRFQLPSGGLGYWPGAHEESEWGTNYAGNFIIEAKKKGYHVPGSFLKGWKKYQKKMARNWKHDGRSTEITQADRLYLLALAGSPELGAMNRIREIPKLDNVAKWRLAAAYKLAGQPEMANRLSRDLTVDVKQYKELGYTYGSDIRDKAIILECIGTIGNRMRGKDLAQVISQVLSDENWLSTQETGYSLIAMAKYAGHGKSGVKLGYKYRIAGGEWKTISTEKPLSQIDLKGAEVLEGKVEVKNTSGAMLFARLVLSGIPVTGDQDGRQSNLKMSVTYMDMEGSAINPTSIEQGTDFVAEVTVDNPGTKGALDELALNQIFPSGWEIHNPRMDGVSFSSEIAVPEYQDVRDDRVYTYFDLGVSNSSYRSPWAYPSRRTQPTKKTFRILLNASYLGKFYLPTVYCEAMYDHSISARIPGKWVTVVAPTEM